MDPQNVPNHVIDDTPPPTEYDNIYVDEFLDRCHSFPRKSVELITPNAIKVITEKSYEGYAWIGASEHNKVNGCQGVVSYNYMLIESRELYIYFKDCSNK